MQSSDAPCDGCTPVAHASFAPTTSAAAAAVEQFSVALCVDLAISAQPLWAVAVSSLVIDAGPPLDLVIVNRCLRI